MGVENVRNIEIFLCKKNKNTMLVAAKIEIFDIAGILDNLKLHN